MWLLFVCLVGGYCDVEGGSDVGFIWLGEWYGYVLVFVDEFFVVDEEF